MKALIIKEFQELRRDHRTLGMLIVLPILLLLILGYAANFTVQDIRVTVSGPFAEEVTDTLSASEIAQEDLVITQGETEADEGTAEAMLSSGETSVVIIADGNSPGNF